MKNVCIVGAGPAGLVGAKVLLRSGKFKVSVFEKSDCIGGIWSQSEDSASGFLSPHTPVNISRFSVGFSDFHWASVDLRSDRTRRAAHGAHALSRAPIFPKAWQVNRYLKAYTQQYIPDGIIQLSHEVVQTERFEEGGKQRWRVTVRYKQHEHTTEFDYLLLASGFFSKPRALSYTVPDVPFSPGVKIIHSSQFRALEDLFNKPADATGKTILVIGGSNSAGEAAAAVAQQLSNARFSPETGSLQLYQDCKIVHVTPKPLYILVPFSPANDTSTAFLPWDLKMYDVSKRPAGPIVGNAGRVPRAVKDMLHGALQGIIGGNQSDLSSALEIPPGEPRWPVQVALSESYAEFVRSGLIEVVSGRVTAIRDTEKSCAIAQVQAADSIHDLQDVGAILYATGYTPASAIDFLPEDVKHDLHYDDKSFRLPLILQGWQTLNLTVPSLAFLGFYEGPYWPIVEMQARLTAYRWINDDFSDVRPYEETERMLDLRKRMMSRETDVPQYWFGDYAGYMEEMASFLKLQRNDGPFAEREGCVAPGRYTSPDTDKLTADTLMQELHEIWQACTKEGKFTARAAFRALQGNWTINRSIESTLPSFPSGTLQGEASFHPRLPTLDKSEKPFDLEYLYIESGTLVLSNGASMSARRRYVYRYSEELDELSVWFVKPDDDFEVDYLFHNLTFVDPDAAEREGACIAKADHLCVEDMYWTEYRLPIQGIALHGFETKHTVKGPSKDYVTTTTYRRPAKIVDA